MKLKNSLLVALSCGSLLGSATLSQAGVLWSLDFNSYGDGNIQNTAVAQPNFPGNWFDGSAFVTSGVVTSGTSKASFNQTFSAAVGATGTIWISFDWGHNNSGDHVDTYGGLTFFEDNYPTLTEKGLLGNTWNAATWNGTSVSTIGMKTAVAKITLSDVDTDTVELWVGNNNTDPVDVGDPPMITLEMELSNVNCVRVNGGNSQSFDNLLIGTTVDDVDASTPPTPVITGTWTNMAGGDWGSAGNWIDNLVGDGKDSTADFSTLDIAADTTVNLDSARTIGNLFFGDIETSSAASWTLTGNTLNLAGTTPTITVNALGETNTVTINSVVSGSAGLTKSGAGTLTLSAANTYSGATMVSNGTLQVSDQSYFNVGRATTVASGAVFELNNSNNTFTTLMPVSTIAGAGTFRLSGNSTIDQSENGVNDPKIILAMDAGGLIDLQGTSRMTNGGWHAMNWTDNLASMNIASDATLDVWDGHDVIIDALTGSGTVDKVHGGNSPRLLKVGVANGSGTFSGTIMNSGGQVAFTKVGSGAQTLSGTNTYSGNTTVEAGTLNITSTGSLRFFPTTNGQTNTLSGTESATLSYLGTVDLDLSAANLTHGNSWAIVNVGSFSGPVPTLEPAAVTCALGSFDEISPGTWELSTIDAKWTFTEADGTLALQLTATDYEIWGATYGLLAGSEAGDLDNDGVTNFAEYAFGLLPNNGASANPISEPLNKTNGVFSYTRRTASDLVYSVWYSTDLVNWTEDEEATEDSTTPSGDNEIVSVIISESLLTEPKLFIQVRAN